MRLFLFALSVLLPYLSFGSHLKAGEITVQQLNCSTNYQITLTIYVNTASPIPTGEGMLDFGDGTTTITQNKAAILIDSYNNVGKVIYVFTHSYANAGTYKISYTEANRNAAIVNIPNSVDVPFEIESQFVVGSKCNNSPQFLIAPIDRSCIKRIFYHDAAAFDPDGDSLSFELTSPGMGREKPMNGYAFPNDPKFYLSGNYSTANQAGNAAPTFTINPVTGLVIWDAPGMIGEFTFAFKVIEWRKNQETNQWVNLGYVIRDMQIIVEDCSNNSPILNVPSEICMKAGESIDLLIKGLDPDLDNVMIEVFSMALNENDPTLSIQHAGEVQPGTGANVNFHWNTNCSHAKNEYYEFVFKITDLPVTGTRLTVFKTMRIKVIAPEPTITNVNVNPAKRTARIQWASYLCSDANIQIWRRVATYEYDQPKCQSGMPKFLGYTLLKELPGDATEFIDADLNIGAQYCYRVIAKMTNKNNVFSRLSTNTCLIPLPAKAPVITNVSVVKTHSQNGSIQIKWRRPFEIDASQYPEPYQYEVWRSSGLEGNDYIKVSAILSDTLFSDLNINTIELAYRYRILLYVPSLTTSPVDTSSGASSVFTVPDSKSDRINLTWKAKVPWANNIQKHPWHYIYRGEEGFDGTFQLLDSILVDSINVNTEDFHYTDKRSGTNPLPVHKKYFYKIETAGGYGNPRIKEPLFNFSQVVEGYTKDTIPPTPPIARINNNNCEQNIAAYSCDTHTFTNSIGWEEKDNDVDHYIIGVADSASGNFVTINASISQLSFSHSNISKLAYCYRVKAVDEDGNESDWSEPVCNDNCPYLELPNVFTPDNGDGFNDYFKTVHCPISVKTVSFKVFDRSGHEVYSRKLDDDLYQIWDGRDNNHKELPAGVYFYSATAEFDVQNSQTAQKNISGWVQLVR